MNYTSVTVTSQRAFLVDMRFSSGIRKTIAVDSLSAKNKGEALKAAQNSFYGVCRQMEADELLGERITVYGSIDWMDAHEDTPAMRRKLGVIGVASYDNRQVRSGWYNAKTRQPECLEKLIPIFPVGNEQAQTMDMSDQHSLAGIPQLLAA